MNRKAKKIEKDSDACPTCGAEYKGQEVEVLGPSRDDKGKTVLAARCLSCGLRYYFKAEEGAHD